jgi:hypothetical protein
MQTLAWIWWETFATLQLSSPCSWSALSVGFYGNVVSVSVEHTVYFSQEMSVFILYTHNEYRCGTLHDTNVAYGDGVIA